MADSTTTNSINDTTISVITDNKVNQIKTIGKVYLDNNELKRKDYILGANAFLYKNYGINLTNNNTDCGLYSISCGQSNSIAVSHENLFGQSVFTFGNHNCVKANNALVIGQNNFLDSGGAPLSNSMVLGKSLTVTTDDTIKIGGYYNNEHQSVITTYFPQQGNCSLQLYNTIGDYESYIDLGLNKVDIVCTDDSNNSVTLGLSSTSCNLIGCSLSTTGIDNNNGDLYIGSNNLSNNIYIGNNSSGNDIYIGANTSAEGTCYIYKTLVADNLLIQGFSAPTITATESLQSNDTLKVTGATTLSGILNVGNDTTLNGILKVTGGTTLKNTSVDNLSIENDAIVRGALSAVNTLKVGNNTTLNGTLNVGNNTTLNGTLNVIGATTLNNTLNVGNNTTLNGTLNVGSNTTIDGVLKVTTIGNRIPLFSIIDNNVPIIYGESAPSTYATADSKYNIMIYLVLSYVMLGEGDYVDVLRIESSDTTAQIISASCGKYWGRGDVKLNVSSSNYITIQESLDTESLNILYLRMKCQVTNPNHAFSLNISSYNNASGFSRANNIQSLKVHADILDAHSLDNGLDTVLRLDDIYTVI